MDKKGRISANTVVAIAALIFTLIIVFVIIQQITTANLLPPVTTTTTVFNETGCFLNATGCTLALVNATHSNYQALAVYNATDGVLIPSANYTLGATTGIITNATVVTHSTINVSYTYDYSAESIEELSTDRMRGNLSSGVDNLSENIPTFFTIIAAVLILGFVVLLWRQFKNSGLASGGSL